LGAILGRRTEDERKQEKTLALLLRLGNHFCPQCGQLRGFTVALLCRRNSASGAFLLPEHHQRLERQGFALALI
jgi:hypothetical protein